MRSSPDVKVRIPAAAGRSCAGAPWRPWGPCSSQSGAATVGLSRSSTNCSNNILSIYAPIRAFLQDSSIASGYLHKVRFKAWEKWEKSATDTSEFLTSKRCMSSPGLLNTEHLMFSAAHCSLHLKNSRNNSVQLCPCSVQTIRQPATNPQASHSSDPLSPSDWS